MQAILIKIKQKKINFFSRKNALIIIAFLLILPFYFYKLSSIPASVHGDEAETALQAIKIIKGETGLIGVGWFDLPLLSFLPHGLFMLFLGENILSDRLGSVIFGILTLPMFYLLLKDFWDKRIALISTILLGTSHMWIALSRIGITYTQSSFLIITAIFILFKAFKTNRRELFIFAGGIFGLSLYSNFAVRIIPILIFAIFINQLFNKLHFKKNLLSLIFFFVTTIIIFLPQGFFYIHHPHALSSREKNIFVFSENAKKWTNYTNMNNLNIFLEQTKRTLNVFAGDNSTQYGYKGPLLDYFSIFFFIAGVIYCLTKIMKFKFQFLFLWIFLALMGQIFATIPPPFFLPRFVVGLPALYIFIGFGIIFITDLFYKHKLNKRHANILIFLIIIAFSFYNLSSYFFRYPKQTTGDYNARAATNIAFILNHYYKNYTAYFYTSPRLYSDFGTLRFLSDKTKRVNLNATDGILKSSEIKYVYIIYPEYLNLIPRLFDNFPKGRINEIRDIDKRIQFYTFAN
jgi:4-amino-4-deoxy-L-arabinose transferase-like glycosyltransferase